MSLLVTIQSCQTKIIIIICLMHIFATKGSQLRRFLNEIMPQDIRFLQVTFVKCMLITGYH